MCLHNIFEPCQLPVSCLSSVFIPQAMADGCLCTAVIGSISFVCTYCVAVYMHNVHCVNVRHASQSLPISWTCKECTHLLFIFVFIFTLHMPNCVNVVLLNVFNWVFLFLVATNCSFVAIGDNLLCMCKALCFHHCLHLLYMVLLLKLGFTMFLDLLLLLTICY